MARDWEELGICNLNFFDNKSKNTLLKKGLLSKVTAKLRTFFLKKLK